MISLKREKAGANKFTLSGLSLGKLLAIKNGLELKVQAAKNSEIGSPVAEELLSELKHLNIESISAFGEWKIPEEPATMEGGE